jgi:hypothetical protein
VVLLENALINVINLILSKNPKSQVKFGSIYVQHAVLAYRGSMAILLMKPEASEAGFDLFFIITKAALTNL